MQLPDILDGFSGPRGWSEGLRRLGLRDIGLEIDTSACDTAHAAGHLTIQCDVAAYPTRPFKGKTRKQIWSPPCQGLSRAGKGRGREDAALMHQAVEDLAHGRDTRETIGAACKDKRSILAAEPMRWLYDLRPEWVCMEQVPEALPLWKQYAGVLREWGYSAWCGILNAADYGVPQTRKRAILIASQDRAVGPPQPTHAEHADVPTLFGPALEPWVCMADALGWGATDRPVPTVTAGGGRTGGAEPFPSQARRILEASRDRGDWVLRNGNQEKATVRAATEPASTLAFGKNSMNVQWVHKRPATTVCGTGRIAAPGHRDRSPGGDSQFADPDTVRITVAEAAVLQSFRPNHPFKGAQTKQFEQVGNAVPPLFAAHILSVPTGIPLATAADQDAA